MLKKLKKSIRRQLLKIDWFNREVEAYQIEQKKQKHHELWERILRGGSMRL